MPDIPFYVTVDGASTRDIDDALHFARVPEGFRVRVAIANPVDLVPRDSPQDVAARRRAATVYRRDVPAQRMLPPAISEDQGSLVEGRLRAAVVFDMTLDAQLRCVGMAVEDATITVGARLTYEDLPRVLGDSSHPAHEALSLGTTLAGQLFAQRRALAVFDLAHRDG